LSHTTWRTCLGVALLLAMSGTVGNSRADIISAMATGNGSSVTSSSYGVGVTFSDYAGGPYPASVVYESIGGANALTLTYNSPGDYDFGGGVTEDRLILDFVNQTGGSLTAVTFSLSGGTFETSGLDPSVGTYSSGTPTFTYSSYISPTDATDITYAFATPLASGSDVAFYLPILTNASSGTYVLSETVSPSTDTGPSSVPEPASLIMVGFGGVLGSGYVWGRRKAKAKCPA
jgi:hypothetical protein